jgi:hypothetical protein
LKSTSVACVHYLLWVFIAAFTLNSVAVAQVEQPTTDGSTAHGTVLFDSDQRSVSAEKKENTPTAQSAVTATDAERASLTFAAYDLDVHLAPAKAQLAVHARFTVRNSGTQPLTRLAFQLSSSLSWESFALQGADRMVPLSFVQHIIDTDADHTGKAQEAVVSLPQPLVPGATVELAAFYSGEIRQSGNRLERIGAPEDQAAHADWDKIAPEGTALRGFGDVLWYPTAAAPVFLGDGAKLFQAAGQSKLQQEAAMIHLRLAVEYVGDPPDAAYFWGRREPLTALSENENLPVANAPGVATAEFSNHRLGFRVPSLFVTDRAATATDGNLISAVTDRYDALPIYAAAAAKVQPVLMDWLGTAPLTALNIIDHDGQPFEDDALLVTPMRATDPSLLASALMHSLTHAWFSSSHEWLDEGVPQFMSLLWVEQSEGRDAALHQLQEKVNALALAEPAPSQTASATQQGQSLIEATDEVYYRTKASAVLWMLRSIVGDDALKRALQVYRHEGKRDEDPRAFQRVLELSAKRNLQWFFDDWVYRDRGLPDLTIASVTPRLLQSTGDKGASWLVAVEVRNDGDAAAEVPVTVRSGDLTITERLRILGRSSASTRILFAGTPDEVLLNDGGVPEMTASTHTKQILIH